jgi:predicted dehydrogenase
MYPGVKTSKKVEDIFNDPMIDAVIISTPVITHYELSIRALEAGKHILVEKPIARSVEEVVKIDELSKKRDLLAMVGHTFLFNAAVRYVKDLIDSGELGEIHYIYSQRLNLGKIRNDVDALWNLAPHDISIIQYWLDDPKPMKIERQGNAYIQKDIDDVVFLSVLYPNNVLANVHVSWLDPQKVRTMTVIGSKKMVLYDDTSENKIAIHDKGIDEKIRYNNAENKKEKSIHTFEYRNGDVLLPKINFEEPLKMEIDHFFDCILSGGKCITGTDHAREVVRILSSEI